MSPMSRPFLAGACAVWLFAVSASATVAIPTEFREIVAGATLIVRGHITEVRAVVARNQGVESIGTIAVEAALKGRLTDFVVIRVPGGVIGRYRWVMVGAPSLHVGDQGIFFLKRDQTNAWRPVGLAMGIFRVQAAPANGVPVVEPPLAAGQTTAAGRVVRGDPQRRLMAVPEFESLVRVVIASQSTQREGTSR